MTCPRCGFALIRYLGHDTCSLGCGFDGERREPTAEERGTYRDREPQFTKRPPMTDGLPRAQNPPLGRATPASVVRPCSGALPLLGQHGSNERGRDAATPHGGEATERTRARGGAVLRTLREPSRQTQRTAPTKQRGPQSLGRR